MDIQTITPPSPMTDVDDLRQQLALFKQRLDKQEIINERLMRRSMSARLNVFTKGSVIVDAIGLLLMPFLCLALSKVGIPWFFGALLMLMVAAELAYNVLAHRHLRRLFTDGGDMLTVRRGLLRFKRSERRWMLISVPLILLWLVALVWQQGLFDGELTGVAAARFIVVSIGAILGLAVCFAFYAWEMHRVNLSIREIDDLSAE